MKAMSLLALVLAAALPAAFAHLPDSVTTYAGSGYCGSGSTDCQTVTTRTHELTWRTFSSTEKGLGLVTVCKGDVVKITWKDGKSHDVWVASSAANMCATPKVALSKPKVGTTTAPGVVTVKTANAKVGKYAMISTVGTDCTVGKMKMILSVREC